MTEIVDTIAVRTADLVDYGQQRLDKARARHLTAQGIITGVAARHAVSVAALTNHHPAKQRHHVIMARAHAASLLRGELFTWQEVAGALGMKHHSLAIRAAGQWGDHLNGRVDVVTEEQGRRALDLMRKKGLSMPEAARQLDLSPIKLRSRVTMIRARPNVEGTTQ